MANSWWCCKAEFGEHEPTCKNYRPNDKPLDPALVERAAEAINKARVPPEDEFCTDPECEMCGEARQMARAALEVAQEWGK